MYAIILFQNGIRLKPLRLHVWFLILFVEIGSQMVKKLNCLSGKSGDLMRPLK